MVSAISTYISLLAYCGGDRRDTGGAIWVYFKRKLPIQLPEYLETTIYGWILSLLDWSSAQNMILAIWVD